MQSVAIPMQKTKQTTCDINRKTLDNGNMANAWALNAALPVTLPGTLKLRKTCKHKRTETSKRKEEHIGGGRAGRRAYKVVHFAGSDGVQSERQPWRVGERGNCQ